MAKRATLLAQRLSGLALPRMHSADEVAVFASIPGQDPLPGFSSVAERQHLCREQSNHSAGLFKAEELSEPGKEVKQ